MYNRAALLLPLQGYSHNMVLSVVLLIVGFVVLIKGADWLVDGASALAKKHNISDLAIGLTIVAFGTSAPELVVNTFAAWQGNSDIVFGNVIGSNNFNLFFILGIAGLITPLVVQSSTVWKEIPLSLLAALILFFLVNNFFIFPEPVLSRLDGIFLLLFFIFFLYYVYTQLKQDNPVSIELRNMSALKIWVFILVGLGSLVLGGKLVLNSSVSIATALGVSEKIIGLTIIAAGTSLPELATSVIAAIKKNNDIAVGNIIGSNIFNVFLILSLSSIIKPVSYNPAFNVDIYMMVFGTLFLFTAMFTGKNRKLDRWEALILLLSFIIYTIFLIYKEG